MDFGINATIKKMLSAQFHICWLTTVVVPFLKRDLNSGYFLLAPVHSRFS